MNVKMIGALLILAGCGGTGFLTAYERILDERFLRQWYGVISYMQWELQYKMSPLPELVHASASQCTGALRRFLDALKEELDSQVSPHVDSCMHAALARIPNLPQMTTLAIKELGTTLGKFSTDGQVQALESARDRTSRMLAQLESTRPTRVRSYEALGLCTGAALVILFI